MPAPGSETPTRPQNDPRDGASVRGSEGLGEGREQRDRDRGGPGAVVRMDGPRQQPRGRSAGGVEGAGRGDGRQRTGRAAGTGERSRACGDPGRAPGPEIHQRRGGCRGKAAPESPVTCRGARSIHAQGPGGGRTTEPAPPGRLVFGRGLGETPGVFSGSAILNVA